MKINVLETKMMNSLSSLKRLKGRYFKLQCLFIKYIYIYIFRIGNLDADRSFESNVRNFLAEENSPNCFGKVKEYSAESSAEEGGSECANTSETYTIESDFDKWNKVSKSV